MTATLTFYMTAPEYSFWGGNNSVLPNGDIEFCETALPTGGSSIYEVSPGANTQTVWTMKVAGQNAYRGQRIGSLYPGVQW